MRRCTGATLLREATSELAPLTTAQLSAPSSIRGCPMSTRPGPKRGLASSLRVHDRSTVLKDHAMRELCARLRARRRAACGRASATVPARDGSRVSFLSSMAAAPLSLASTESGRLGPHRRAAQAGLEHVAVVGVRCCRGSALNESVSRETPLVRYSQSSRERKKGTSRNLITH